MQKKTDTDAENNVHVIVDLPAHSPIDGALTYSGSVAVGTLVRAPLGKKNVAGIVWDKPSQSGKEIADENQLFEVKPLLEVFDVITPLNRHWRALVKFTADYYQRSLGEVALQALPPALRKLDAKQLGRRLARLQKNLEKNKIQKNEASKENLHQPPELTIEQASALGVIEQALSICAEWRHRDAQTITNTGTDKPATPSFPAAFLLQGATGSGKTEVYMRATQQVLQAHEQAQVLVLVPEINLTPQLEARFQERFPAHVIVSMHSGMTAAQRLQAWLLAHAGHANIVLGTRMAIFASMPNLKLIVVDEEHDPSYKQYEGARWSARDLAIWRGRAECTPVILGSATPSLESWLHTQKGSYKLLAMPSRIGAGNMPKVHLVDMQQIPRGQLLAPKLVQAMQERINLGQQSLVLLNRRGYAPVLYCSSCGWKSQCPNCTALRVFHRVDRTLRCHHCGFTQPVPRACPDCGDPDIQPIGKGTERLEELLQETLVRPDGTAAKVLRIDADSTRHAGELVKHLEQVHEGDVDILVGTQMIAKGHDFRKVTLVAAVNPDTALLSNDFRSGERLFSLLMQAAGRAGRDEGLAEHSELWVQTLQPTHPLLKALKTYDYAAFANATLKEREMAAMPPYYHLAMVRGEGRTQEAVQDFLGQINKLGQTLLQHMGLAEHVMLYPPIPAAMQRIANMERGQMMVESASRQALQHFLAHWRFDIRTVRVRGVVRWAIDVDPQSV